MLTSQSDLYQTLNHEVMKLDSIAIRCMTSSYVKIEMKAEETTVSFALWCIREDADVGVMTTEFNDFVEWCGETNDKQVVVVGSDCGSSVKADNNEAHNSEEDYSEVDTSEIID
ncbi:hypothetical protein HDU76_001599 [Blyttiomyces sp. JEL0837]|nr:hypothetical protein HDU76_001599 [Blyttiomyces sp. JEL0837]